MLASIIINKNVMYWKPITCQGSKNGTYNPDSNQSHLARKWQTRGSLGSEKNISNFI